MFDNACIVVAHPDDEVLWFSSVLSRVERIIICFQDNPDRPQLGPARAKAIRQLNDPRIHCLGLTEPSGRQVCDWELPQETSYGLKPPAELVSRFQLSHQGLMTRLSPLVRGCDTIITHNPWGDYGHEMHVQVFRALETIAKAEACRLLFSNYVSTRSAKLERTYRFPTPEPELTLTTNRELAAKRQAVYRDCGAWTGPQNHVWPEKECFNFLPVNQARSVNGKSLFPLNSVSVGSRKKR